MASTCLHGTLQIFRATFAQPVVAGAHYFGQCDLRRLLPPHVFRVGACKSLTPFFSRLEIALICSLLRDYCSRPSPSSPFGHSRAFFWFPVQCSSRAFCDCCPSVVARARVVARAPLHFSFGPHVGENRLLRFLFLF